MESWSQSSILCRDLRACLPLVLAIRMSRMEPLLFRLYWLPVLPCRLGKDAHGIA